MRLHRTEQAPSHAVVSTQAVVLTPAGAGGLCGMSCVVKRPLHSISSVVKVGTCHSASMVSDLNSLDREVLEATNAVFILACLQ